MHADAADGSTPARSAEELAARADARELLPYVLGWRMPAAWWDEVEEIIEAMAAAVRSGDIGGLRDAVDDLSLIDPVRSATRIEHADPPENLKYRVNRLIDDLGKDSGDSTDDPDPGRGKRG